MSYFHYWYENNIGALEHLYDELIKLSKSYGINIIDNQQTINNFIKMMYNESDGQIIKKNLFPEYFN